MKVLVTSSTGLTGKAIVKAMASRNLEVRAMIHSPEKSEEMLRLGASETVTGDIASRTDLLSAMEGVDAIYYICPTARQDEAEIGKMAISAAADAGIRRFIYQSVLHSIEPALPHHRQKLEIERTLIGSGLCYSIVRPAPFMQNLLNAKDALIHQQTFVQKFFTSPDSSNRINLLDAADFAQCVAEIVCGKQYLYATLDLCGPSNLSAADMISAMHKVLACDISLRYITDEELRKSMTQRSAPEYSIDILLRMFSHYNAGDFCGSDFIATAILGREPATIVEFLERELL